MYNIGKFKTFVEILQPTETQSATGNMAREFSNYGYAWASMENINSIEAVNSEAITNQNIYKFTLRYVPGLTNEMQISWNDRLFNITSIVEDPNLRWQVVMVVE